MVKSTAANPKADRPQPATPKAVDPEARVNLKLRSPQSCTYDIVSLGEVMLRLDPGDMRVRTARNFTAWEGGGEYNVARGLSKVFRKRAAVVTALADNEVGRLIEDFIMTGGVDPQFIQWVPYDGVGEKVRNGLNFTERGFGLRAALGVSDRGHTAISQMRPDAVDWDHLFGTLGVRWFHTGGIYAALSDQSAQTVVAAIEAAKRHGTVVSYDLNYRPSLWDRVGGPARAQEVNQAIAPLIDVMIGNEEDFTASLGFEVQGADAQLSDLEVDGFVAMVEQVAKAYPNFQVIANTIRTVHTASDNDWAAIAWSAPTGVVHSTWRENVQILDRVGGGDSFASGLIYGLLENLPLVDAVNYGAAHGALAQTTPGDTSMARLEDVENLVAGGSTRIVR